MSKKIVSDFSQKVYNLCSQIPTGYVSTYKYIAKFINSSPRAVGQVLKNNPNSPVVPCHRVIASNYFIGGFQGKWGKGREIENKKKKLAEEKVFFNEKGYLLKNLRAVSVFKDFCC
jgi:methylated-DNA-[protein]-cysteine S-methyltransferase